LRHSGIVYDIFVSVNWNTEKNVRLKAERDVSFEEVLAAKVQPELFLH